MYNKISLKQIKYFNKLIKFRSKSKCYILIFNSYKSYISANFEVYYKENSIIIFYLLSLSFYLIYFLNISYFNTFKLRYNNKFNKFIKAYINYIINIKLLKVFRIIYFINNNLKIY